MQCSIMLFTLLLPCLMALKHIYAVSCEGGIGVGKSLMFDVFESHYKSFINANKIRIFREPVSGPNSFTQLGNTDFNPLEQYYLDKSKNAYFFQRYVLNLYDDRYNMFSQLPSGTICLLERGIDSTKLFTEINKPYLTKDEYQYLVLKHKRIVNYYFGTDFGTHSLFYLWSQTPWCMHNIKTRGRKEEQNINTAYLQDLHDWHEEYFVACQLGGVPCFKHNAETIALNNADSLFSFLRDLIKNKINF